MGGAKKISPGWYAAIYLSVCSEVSEIISAPNENLPLKSTTSIQNELSMFGMGSVYYLVFLYVSLVVHSCG